MNTSISQRLHDQLGQIIETTKPGHRLPSEPNLAKQLGVSRATLREAMRIYEVQGVLRRRQGSGTYVNHLSRVIESGLEVLESLETLSKRIGLAVQMGDLKMEVRMPTEEEQIALGTAPQSNVTSIKRVILAEGRPVAYLIDVLPENILMPQNLPADFSGSILDILLKRKDLSLHVSRTEINAVTATTELSRALGIQRGDVLLRFIADLYTTDGKVVDHSCSYFLPGYFRFHVIRRIG